MIRGLPGEGASDDFRHLLSRSQELPQGTTTARRSPTAAAKAAPMRNDPTEPPEKSPTLGDPAFRRSSSGGAEARGAGFSGLVRRTSRGSRVPRAGIRATTTAPQLG